MSRMQPEQHQFDQKLLLESMIENDENLPTKNQTQNAFLLLDADEHLTVHNKSDFIRRLESQSEDPTVKCLSIIGNTGDGKSYTLNRIFFNGEEKFRTSSSSDSCTMGVWAALDEPRRTLLLDTEGRLGFSQNDNVRNRLLLKILCISDVIIYRTRAPKLPNDMFQFLSDASNAFHKFFRREIENVMRTNQIDGPISTMGPTLIVFHETQHTDTLRENMETGKTAVEQLKERFDKMKLSYDAYSSIEYVGTQTNHGRKTNFSEMKATILEVLENNKIRSPRRLSIIFRALKALNEKFNHTIPPDVPSTLPDDFFSCFVKCLSCGAKCTQTANHQKDGIAHRCEKLCSYNKELDNEVWKCLACHRSACDTTVYGKLITKNDGLVQGLIRYVWSGFVIECPNHGELYRSRKYWYGNSDPKDVTFVDIVHVWPGENNARLASDVTPRKFMEMILYAGSYLSAPTKMLTELMADQVAPSYWVRNKDVLNCTNCTLAFGNDFSKHHCRACGYVFCDTCTHYRRIVRWIDPDYEVRVCKQCYNTEKLEPPMILTTNHTRDLADGSTLNRSETVSGIDMPTTRRVYETVKHGLEKIGVSYSLKLLKDSTRPAYWKPDNECVHCCICQIMFNSTTHRLHHCRNCGDGVCQTCSPNKRPVPERDWLTAVRVCKLCEQSLDECKNQS